MRENEQNETGLAATGDNVPPPTFEQIMELLAFFDSKGLLDDVKFPDNFAVKLATKMLPDKSDEGLQLILGDTTLIYKMQGHDELLGFFEQRGDNRATVAELMEWATGRNIGPAILLHTIRNMVEHWEPATPEMFDRWADFTLQFVGEAEGRSYIEQELGAGMETATDDEKLAVFLPKGGQK